MIKVLRVGTFPTDAYPGVGLSAYHISNQDNIQTLYVTPKLPGQPFSTPKNCNIKFIDFDQSPRDRNSGFLKKISFWIRRLSSVLRISFKSIFWGLRENVKIVHIHSPMYLLIGIFAKIFRKKLLITFHGTDFHRIKNSRLYHFFSPIFDGVFYISPDMKSDLERIHRHADLVSPVFNGVDTEKFINQGNERKKQIIAVGSLKLEKGFEFLISAMPSILKKFPDYRLIIVGEGNLRPQLSELIDSLDLKNKISLLGHKGSQELIELYNQSEVFVLSSISEGFPKVILEAISCGCKVVATDVGAVSAVLPQNYPFICPPNDSSALSETIQNAILDKDENRDELDKVVSNFSWDKVRKDYFDLIGQVSANTFERFKDADPHS